MLCNFTLETISGTEQGLNGNFINFLLSRYIHTIVTIPNPKTLTKKPHTNIFLNNSVCTLFIVLLIKQRIDNNIEKLLSI